MATKAQATSTAQATETMNVSEAFRQRLMARYEDETTRGVIKSFATAYFNNGSNALKRLGMELSLLDAKKANWLSEINSTNAKKQGYSLHTVKRGSNSTEVMVFDKFYCHIIQQSDKLIEYTGANDVREREINGHLVRKYDQVGVIENADGTVGSGRQLYYDLREQYPGEFSSRRYFLIMITDQDGEQLHSLPICLSLKGTALVSFEDGLNAVATSIGAMESKIIGKQDASPLSVTGLSGYNIFIECEAQEAGNGEQTSDITGIKSMGGVTIENIEQKFDPEKEELFNALRQANADFQVKYNKQLVQEAGIGHAINILAASSASNTEMVLPGTIG